MSKLIWLVLLLAAPCARAQLSAFPVTCNAGAVQATTQGMKSTNFQQGIIPRCTITVYQTGSTTLATIYADRISTPLSNPFTALSSGQANFYASSTACFDIVLSGGVAPNTYPAPITIPNVCAGGGGSSAISGTLYSLPGFVTSIGGGSGTLGSTTISTDSTGNNLYVPNGNINVTSQPGQNNGYITYNCPNCNAFTSYFNLAPANHDIANQGMFYNTITSNYGLDVGYPGQGLLDADVGETATHDSYEIDFNVRNGIHQGHLYQYTSYHNGDDGPFYGYGDIRCGTVSGASEGCWWNKVNGTGAQGYPIGTVTSTTGTGDTAPVLSTDHIGPGSAVMDISHPVLNGTMVAQATALYGATNLYLLNIAGATATPSATCALQTYIPLTKVPAYGSLAPYAVTCTVIQGAFTNGKAMIASGIGPEGTTISNYSLSGSTASFTVMTTNPHLIGDVITQGGTHGCLSEDQNLNLNHWRTSYYIFGAADATHLLTGRVVEGRMTTGPPVVGYEQATAGGAFHVYSCAWVDTVGPTGTLIRTQQNDVPWVAGDTFENPPNPTNQWQGEVFNDTQNTPVLEGQQAGNLIRTAGGSGVNSEYKFLLLWNKNGCTLYYGCTGTVWAPSGVTEYGIFADNFLVDQPIGMTLQGNTCAGRTVICITHSDRTKNYNLYDVDDITNLAIQIDTANAEINFMSSGLGTNAPLNFSNATMPGITVLGVAPSGHVLRGNGSFFTDGTIQNSDLPQNLSVASYSTTGTTPGEIGLAAGTGSIPALAANSAGFAAPATGGTSYLFKLPATAVAGVLTTGAPATGDGVNESPLTIVVGFTGSCASTTTLTVVKGIITGCS